MVKMEIERLLRVTWVAAILPILIASFPSSYLNSFHHTLLVFAGRGKILQSSSRFSVILLSSLYFSFI